MSPDTLEVCHRIVSDELAHAELSREVLLAAGGSGTAIAIDRDQLWLADARGLDLEFRALAVVGRVFCCGETVAVPLFLAIREATSEPAARPVVDRIVRDEAVHRAFGWDTLDELLERLGEPGAAFARDQVGGWLDWIATSYRVSPDAPALAPGEAQWGLIESPEYARIAQDCVDDVVRPRFAARGLLPSTAVRAPTGRG
jgi:hypothetical protein